MPDLQCAMCFAHHETIAVTVVGGDALCATHAYMRLTVLPQLAEAQFPEPELGEARPAIPFLVENDGPHNLLDIPPNDNPNL